MLIQSAARPDRPRLALAALLLVTAVHLLLLRYWLQHPPQPRQPQSAAQPPVLQAVLLPASPAASDAPDSLPAAQPLSEEALARARVTEENAEPATAKRARRSSRQKKGDTTAERSSAQQPGSIQADMLQQQTAEADTLNHTPHASETAPTAQPTTDDSSPAIDATAIDPMAMPGTPDNADNADAPDDSSGDAQETLLLPDMRETAQTAHDRGSPAADQGVTDEDWLRTTPATLTVRTVTQQEYASNPPPAYPEQSQQLGEEGTVHLRATVSAQGAVISLRITQSSGFGMLDNAASTAVRRWRLEPGSDNGRPVQSEVDIPVVFQLTTP